MSVPLIYEPASLESRTTVPSQFGWAAHPSAGIARRPNFAKLAELVSLVQNRVHVSRADAVGANAISSPFGCETAFHREYGSFASVVCHLWLREIHAMARNICYENNRPSSALFDHLSCCSLSADERAGSIDIDDLPPLRDRQVECMGAFTRLTSKIANPPRPCSRRASQAYRPSFPAPPVTIALPVTLNRFFAPASGSISREELGGGIMDEVLPSLRIIL